MTARWYVLHVYSGFEKRVAGAIQEKVATDESLGAWVDTDKIERAGDNKKIHYSEKGYAELAQAIATVATLFRGRFPDARPNLRPWREDAQTRAFAERESVDLSFHFPGWSPRTQCRSLLVQLRLEQAPAPTGAAASRPRLLGVILRGLTYESERWRLATVGDWRPTGSHLPSPAVEQSLQQFCHDLFDLFTEGDGTASQGADSGPGSRAA